MNMGGTLRHPQVPQKDTFGRRIYHLAIFVIGSNLFKTHKNQCFKKFKCTSRQTWCTTWALYPVWGTLRPPPPSSREGYKGKSWLFCHWFKYFKKLIWALKSRIGKLCYFIVADNSWVFNKSGSFFTTNATVLRSFDNIFADNSWVFNQRVRIS